MIFGKGSHQKGSEEMGTKIDYASMLEPLLVIAKLESLSAEERLEKVIEAMENILKRQTEV